MKMPYKPLIDRYREAGYPEESIACLHYLESRTGRLHDLLESYRHLQPCGKLFAPETIGIIKELHVMIEYISSLEHSIDELQKQINPDLGSHEFFPPEDMF